MNVVALDRSGDYLRPTPAVQPAGTVVARPVTAPKAQPSIDPFEAADVEFDFEAGERAAAATLRRDQQQAMLAELADAPSAARASVQVVLAAYAEFDE